MLGVDQVNGRGQMTVLIRHGVSGVVGRQADVHAKCPVLMDCTNGLMINTKNHQRIKYQVLCIKILSVLISRNRGKKS